jgi:hypothetical protein
MRITLAAFVLFQTAIGHAAPDPLFDGAASPSNAPVFFAGDRVQAGAQLERAKPTSAASTRFSGGYLGLFPESAFDLTTGRCKGCRAPREGQWYFQDEVIAVPKSGSPAIVWVGSNVLLEGVRLSGDGRFITLKDGTRMPLSLVPKIASNRSYFDVSSVAYMSGRTIRLRGEIIEENGVKRFIARTIWPEDFRVDFGMPLKPLDYGETLTSLVKENDGGAKEPFTTRLLWAKPGADRDWGGKPVCGVMLNGAQGDDDETHAGHFSLGTGRLGHSGEISDWLFANFYDMDLVSEKGILPAPVPMDKYLADLNSGQNYYRPTYVLAAVLKDERTAVKIQEEFRAFYPLYYAHEVKYDRVTMSCAGLIIDNMRKAGWNVPQNGPDNPVTAGTLALLTFIGTRDKSAAKSILDMAAQDQTRLFPSVAFEKTGGDLLNLVGDQGATPRAELMPFERMLQEDLVALILVRVPQIPSSRKWGQAPVGSVGEYFLRAPLLHSQWQTNPNASRPYPPPHDE